jgi:hypothetical protein
MAVTFSDYLTAVQKLNTHQIIKIEFLRPQDNTPYKTVIQEISGASGSYSERRGNGQRRSCDLTLINFNVEFTPNIDGTIWVNRKFKLYLGVRVNGEDYFIPKGVYILTNPVISPFGADKTVNVNGIDKYALLDGTLGGKLDTTILIANGTNLVTAIRTLLNLANDTSEMVYTDYYYTRTLPYNLYIEAGSTLAEGIKSIAEYATANVYYNENGNFVFEQDTSDASKTPLLSLSDTADEKLLFSGSFTYNFEEVINSLTVIGDNVNGNIARATYKNEDPTSEISVGNIGEIIGDVIFDDIIDTDNYAEQRAIYEVRRRSRMFIDGNMVFKKLYHLSVDEVIEVDCANMNWSNKKLLIDSISMGLDVGGEMSISVKDAVEFV